MTSMRSHLQAMHTAHADFHSKAAQAHMSLSKCFGKSEMEGAEEIAAGHEQLAKAHTEAGQYAVGCAKTLDSASKAMDGYDGDALVPLPVGLSTIFTKDYPPNTLRAVPRGGAPSLSDLPGSVPIEFAKMVNIEDE